MSGEGLGSKSDGTGGFAGTKEILGMFGPGRGVMHTARTWVSWPSPQISRLGETASGGEPIAAGGVGMRDCDVTFGIGRRRCRREFGMGRRRG